MHGPDGNCVEVSTAYSNYGSGTVAQVQWYDFCSGSFGQNVLPIDSYFQDNYLRVLSNESSGLPEYTAEIKRMPDGTWHAFVYNYSQSQYVDYYAFSASTSNYNGGQGWAIFETHYGKRDDNSTTSDCSRLPTIAAEGIRLNNGSWHLVTSSEAQTYDQVYGTSQPTQCFGSPYSSPYYSPTYNIGTDAMWEVYTY